MTPTRTGLLRSKAAVVVLSVLGAGAVLVTGSRPWVSGTVHDAVLGTSLVTATGAQVAPGLSALALVVAAAAIATVTGGRAVRVVSTAIAGPALVGLAVLLVRVAADPSGLLGPVAAASVGRTGSLATSAGVTAWPAAGSAGLLLAAVGWVGGLLGARSWSAPSARYERPGAGAEAGSGPRGQRVSSDWDRLSAGIDPTDVGEDSQT
jgi:uncharacterized membrane protein (TIGR02234 family)